MQFQDARGDCEIASIDETNSGYLAALRCAPKGQNAGQAVAALGATSDQAQGQTPLSAPSAQPRQGAVTSERVHMAVSGEMMNLTWVDRDLATVKLLRCPGSPQVADPANPLEKMMKKKGDEPPSQPSS